MAERLFGGEPIKEVQKVGRWEKPRRKRKESDRKRKNILIVRSKHRNEKLN